MFTPPYGFGHGMGMPYGGGFGFGGGYNGGFGGGKIGGGYRPTLPGSTQYKYYQEPQIPTPPNRGVAPGDPINPPGWGPKNQPNIPGWPLNAYERMGIPAPFGHGMGFGGGGFGGSFHGLGFGGGGGFGMPMTGNPYIPFGAPAKPWGPGPPHWAPKPPEPQPCPTCAQPSLSGAQCCWEPAKSPKADAAPPRSQQQQQRDHARKKYIPPPSPPSYESAVTNYADPPAPANSVKGQALVKTRQGAGLILPKKLCTFHVVRGKRMPFAYHKLRFEFDVYNSPTSMSVREFIEQLGSLGKAPWVIGRSEDWLSVGVVECLEQGSGEWQRGSTILWGDERAEGTLAECGWDEQRGEAGRGKPVVLCYVG